MKLCIPKIKISREGNVTKDDVKEVAEKVGQITKEKVSNLKARLGAGLKAFVAPLAN